MSTLFVAASPGLQAWAADVGLTKIIYAVGIADQPGEEAIEALNAGRHAGRNDWKLIGEQAVDGLSEADALDRLRAKETLIDPRYYPQIKGAPGIVKVKLANVENALMVQRALAGELTKALKVKPADIAAYLIRNAQGR